MPIEETLHKNNEVMISSFQKSKKSYPLPLYAEYPIRIDEIDAKQLGMVGEKRKSSSGASVKSARGLIFT